MGDTIFLLEKLKSKAIEENNTELLKTLNSDSFYNSLIDVTKTLQKLNFEINSKDEVFNYEKEINLKISHALAQNYFVMYYVNITTNDYVGYARCDKYQSLKITNEGTDFFNDAIKNAQVVIYKDDIEFVTTMLKKEKILDETKNGQTYSFTYRLLLNNIPTYVSLMATRLIDDPNNLIIGVSNVDNLIRRELEYKKQVKQNVTYSNIALSLVKDYFVIYYVNIDNSNYIEYTLNDETQSLNFLSKGEDFFFDSKMNARRYIVPEDQDKFINALDRDYLLSEIESGTYKLIYRQIINNKPVYVAFKCMKLASDANHFVLAVSNIDAQTKKENKYKRELALEKSLARTDALTGASNKFSYNEFEKEINEHISKKLLDQFAVVICDINDLKQINDTLGHDAGDEYIKSAMKVIKSVFKHSTIFRIGGDEFVSVLDGNDYYNREYLLKKLRDTNIKNMNTTKAVVACGMSDFIPNVDTKLIDVFKRADEAMYKDKKELKEIGAK